MKILSIQKTTIPEIRFRSLNDWRKYIANECKKLKSDKNGRTNR